MALGDQSGGVPVQPVYSPGWNPAVYGPPTAPSPTLGVVSSAALVNPGQPFTVKATLNNPGSAPLRDAAVNLNAPAGWTVAPAGPASLGTVAPGRSASATFQVTPASSGSSSPGPVDLVAQSTYDVSGQSRTLLGTAQLQVPFAPWRRASTTPASPTTATRTRSSGFEGFDGEGTTFSAQGLASAGLAPGAAVSAGGLSFTWPNVPSAQPDNTMAEGQIIRVSGSGSELGFLASANNSPESGTGTVYYTDGTTSTYTLDVGNFWYASGQSGNPTNDQVAVGELRQLPDRLLGPHGLRVRAVGPDRLGKDGRGGRVAAAGERRRLQPGAPRVRGRRRELIGRRSGARRSAG